MKDVAPFPRLSDGFKLNPIDSTLIFVIRLFFPDEKIKTQVKGSIT